MPNTWDDETKKKIAEGQRAAYENGTRKAPVTVFKERWEETQAKLEQMRKELEELKRWREEVRAVARKHREIIEKGAQKESSVGEMCKDLLDVLGS